MIIGLRGLLQGYSSRSVCLLLFLHRVTKYGGYKKNYEYLHAPCCSTMGLGLKRSKVKAERRDRGFSSFRFIQTTRYSVSSYAFQMQTVIRNRLTEKRKTQNETPDPTLMVNNPNTNLVFNSDYMALRYVNVLLHL